jgi:hypothetical protein
MGHVTPVDANRFQRQLEAVFPVAHTTQQKYVHLMYMKIHSVTHLLVFCLRAALVLTTEMHMPLAPATGLPRAQSHWRIVGA